MFEAFAPVSESVHAPAAEPWRRRPTRSASALADALNRAASALACLVVEGSGTADMLALLEGEATEEEQRSALERVVSAAARLGQLEQLAALAGDADEEGSTILAAIEQRRAAFPPMRTWDRSDFSPEVWRFAVEEGPRRSPMGLGRALALVEQTEDPGTFEPLPIARAMFEAHGPTRGKAMARAWVRVHDQVDELIQRSAAAMEELEDVLAEEDTWRGTLRGSELAIGQVLGLVRAARERRRVRWAGGRCR